MAALASLLFGVLTGRAYAQQVAGDAPFIDSWLVSGPFGSPVVEKLYECETGEPVNEAPRASEMTASSSTLAVNPVAYLVDGDTRKQWVTENDSTPWVNLKWSEPIALNEVRIAQWGDSRHVNKWYHLTFTLDDGSKVESGQVDSASNPTLYTAQPGLKNVREMRVEIDKGREPYPPITGIAEIEVYNRTEPAEGKSKITPQVGEALSFGGESRKWDYFDDRVYNRNYDDYQDLYGYYTVKRGVDTRNKYVYAHTYVYSPQEQRASFNVGASGSYRLFVNDRCVTGPSTPAEVQKDLTKTAVQLHRGWNKLMVQIRHTYTEDVNASGVPVAQDKNVAYLGFYGRVADQAGNRIAGLVNSVAGPSDTLTIVSQGLPVGYQEWPYVWNKSVSGNPYGVSASAFQFMAAGGTPGYTWKVTAGKLPDGLELNPDGTIADGLVNGKVDLNSTKGVIGGDAKPGDHHFTVQVTDGTGSSATKDFTLTVKERPNKWFEQGRVGALTHATAVYGSFVDPNFSVERWAGRAKSQGHSLVSVETNQQAYFWPSKFCDPKSDRHLYYPKDEHGNVLDGIKKFEQAVKRQGIRFGLYYASRNTDVTVQDIADLIHRYDPSYLYFDGPQGHKSDNFDVIYSSIRNYSDTIIVNSNAWGEEYGDPDLRTAEASGIYANASRNHLLKRTTMEPWKMIHTRDELSPYYGKRDDYRQVAKEMVMNAGRGYADNNDQSIIDSRGPNWHTPQEIATRYPKAAQEFIDVRENLIGWFAPEGGPERHESTTGTTPYFLSGHGYEDDGRGNYEKFAFPNDATGPQWGYATARDNAIYLHIMRGPDGKKGFDAIPGRSLTISPVGHRVTSVTGLNANVPITSFSQHGDSLSINLADVREDPVDTIIKIVTDDPARTYKLTDVVTVADQIAPSMLKVRAEGYMTYPALKVKLSDLTYRSANPAVAAVHGPGVVTARSNGTTTITVSGRHEGVTGQGTLRVRVRDGVVHAADDMIDASLLIAGKEAYGEFPLNDGLRYTLEGRSAKGGPVGLGAARIRWHGGIVDLSGGDKDKPIAIHEVDTFSFGRNKIITPAVDKPTRGVVWADVTLDGKTVTTNRVFMDLLPYRNLARTAEITSSHPQGGVANLVDGRTIEGARFDQSKWSVPAGEAAWIQFKLPANSDLSGIAISFNSLDQKYLNIPKTIKIQISEDGASWNDAGTINGPTGTADFGFPNRYPLSAKARYVRLAFNGDANGSMIDLLEVAINGR
ncbi:discoidin domain-containing protein [Nonomuraea rhodomycinica]|uniref:Discoidin domain-containing protein n=1 Tax=Nonomuraea rhodomycinica TaxID=1712872 RepID=A0A7Y6MGG9_9ACTN|nr:discoidin domain-containing protein [Nonomuraea rhodomycinica]NUW46040.1 discoidin domain-containing protein [Nonomuraea rhodomycinica]